MSRINLLYVKRYKDRHKTLRHYFRRHGFKSHALPGLPGSDEFMSAYAACLAGEAPKRQIGVERTAPGTIAALVAAYFDSADYKNLRDSTKKGYRNILERFRTAHGHRPIRGMDAAAIRRILDKASPGAANNLRKRIRTLMQFAVERGYREDNPALVVRRPKFQSVPFAPWTEDNITAFKDRWPSGSKPRRALALLLCTGQRRSDVHLMGRQHLVRGDKKIRVKQLKTGQVVVIRIHPELQAELDHVPNDMTFILTEAGKPFTADGFTHWFVKRAKDAGLEGLAPHGLRKAAGRRLAEAGCTAKQIMSILGHKTLAEAEEYTRDADREQLADDAMDNLERAEK